MNIVNQFENRASRSRGTHEGESSTALCDRPSRTRDSSPRQLPTDHDHAVPTREYQTDQSSPILPRLLLALSLKNKNHPTAVQGLTGSLHIRAGGLGKMTEKLFADVALHEDPMPIELLLNTTLGEV